MKNSKGAFGYFDDLSPTKLGKFIVLLEPTRKYEEAFRNRNF